MKEQALSRIKERLHYCYGEEDAEVAYQEICDLLQAFPSEQPLPDSRWSHEDVMLITYGDTFQKEGEVPLETLSRFLKTHIKDAINNVHILPFFPYSSDDGFSVIDYTLVNPDLGGWPQVEAIGDSYQLMFDLVVNHISRESLWFTDFKANIPPFNEFFIAMEGSEDVSQVTRPRNTPLLVPAYTHRGRKMVWATFSADQIDLNFKNPKVLIKMLEVLLLYLEKGAKTIRLDAIAFLWKELGSKCIHLPETHQMVKLFRDVMSIVRPESILLTETNVPHLENLSYFGQQDEAHMVYQFALAPLVLHALHRGDGSYLTEWVSTLDAPPKGCTFLNFTASPFTTGVISNAINNSIHF